MRASSRGRMANYTPPNVGSGVIFDHVQQGLPIGPFRLAPRADIPQCPLYEYTP
jgi:hypothetical protein